MEHKDVFLLETIVNYCDRLLSYVEEEGIDKKVFGDNYRVRDLCSFYIFQIGEYSHALSDAFKFLHPEIKWHRINGMRNLIAHDYGDNIDLSILWNVVVTEIPVLRDFCVKAIGASE